MLISEKSLEASIEEALLAGGYKKRSPENYDRSLCLLPDDVLSFIYATQPKEWEKFKDHHGSDAKTRFLKLLSNEIASRGTLDVLRKGIKDTGCKFKLGYFKPVSGLNDESLTLYKADIFSVVRQLAYSEKTGHSLDMALFINGLPVFTAELKNPLTGQNVKHAIAQYCADRDPHEPLFKFRRCLAHFAVDPDQVFMSTCLKSKKTRFLPFNQGWNNGAGNPPSAFGYSTAYLWENIWTPDSVLNMIQHFIHIVEDEDDKGCKTGTHTLIFPRFHQLDCVRRLIEDARVKGSGKYYLIQHSAGSGKSNSIAWLAHQLSVLHNDQDKPVFDSVIIITDRRVLDRQLQRTVLQFEQVRGVVENIDTTSKQLKTALEEGKRIIVTTLQKFGVIVDQIAELPVNNFAVIIDEAHSSQSGESTKHLKSVLSATTLEEAEKEDSIEEEDVDDKVVSEMQKRGRLPNVSYFAFTATPKPKTLELFGRQRDDGKFEPFSLYSMRQAIEERFIMDVLQNYTVYETYWKLLKTAEDDPHFDKEKATFLLKSFVEHHTHNIEKKVEIMVEHFVSKCAPRIGGKAKAMIVTRSRKHAVRYKLALDKYLKQQGYPYKSLVAFSGTVEDEGHSYTEAGMNGFSDKQTADTFKRDEYRILVVANKFQTGFDQPLLHTMYVDKVLGGVNAVQTLSRLNRVCAGKNETMVLDFANIADAIRKSFQPYYEKTILSEGTDPHLLYEIEAKLADFGFYTADDINRFVEIIFGKKPKQEKIYAALVPSVDKYNASTKEERIEFRGNLKDYIRLYAFLSQIISFTDADLEKLYIFGRILFRRLQPDIEKLPIEIEQDVDLGYYRPPQDLGTENILLSQELTELNPMKSSGGNKPNEPVKEPLSEIIEKLNERFGANLNEEDKVVIMQVQESLRKNAALEASVRANSKDNAKLTFDVVVDDEFQKIIDSNFKFYKQVNDNKAFGKALIGWMFEQYLAENAQQPVSGNPSSP